MSMRLVIDCFKLVKGAGKSIGIYNMALNLVQNLVIEKQESSNIEEKNCEILIIGNQYNKDDFNVDGVSFIQITHFNPLNKIHCLFWELFAVSHYAKKNKADKIIFPRGFCALTHPVCDIIIVHDLIPFYYNENYPSYFNKFENAYIMARLKASIKSCRKVITISEASKKEILKYCKVKEGHVQVIYNGRNSIVCPDSKETSGNQYICAITSSLPHKNAKGVFESYKKYCEISEKPLDLVVVGVDETYKDNLPIEIRSKVTCYKYIKDNKELHRTIHDSSLFLFLSLVEGFGFPPIEAMQLGVPVVCSDRSSLPEIVGDAAILVNPENYDDVAKAIEKLVNDDYLRALLINKGEKNINRFDWNLIAKQYWAEFVRNE